MWPSRAPPVQVAGDLLLAHPDASTDAVGDKVTRSDQAPDGPDGNGEGGGGLGSMVSSRTRPLVGVVIDLILPGWQGGDALPGRPPGRLAARGC